MPSRCVFSFQSRRDTRQRKMLAAAHVIWFEKKNDSGGVLYHSAHSLPNALPLSISPLALKNEIDSLLCKSVKRKTSQPISRFVYIKDSIIRWTLKVRVRWRWPRTGGGRNSKIDEGKRNGNWQPKQTYRTRQMSEKRVETGRQIFKEKWGKDGRRKRQKGNVKIGKRPQSLLHEIFISCIAA